MLNPTSREIALDLLIGVLDRRQPLDILLESNRDLAALEARDRGFARVLVSSVLRHLGALDHAIDGALTEPDLKPVTRHILRLGLAQLRYLNTPPHAAISSAVDLAEIRAPRLKGMVNAILRRHEDLIFDDSPAINMPPWLWQRWVSTYGEEQAAAIVVASLREAPLDFTVKDRGDWAAQLDAQELPLGTLRREAGGAIEALPGFAEGAWWVQDLAASLPVKLMGDLAGKTVFDLCAAPGGKTAQLCATGAIVTAVDRSKPRLKRVTQNLERLGLQATIVTADAAAWQPDTKADAILLDAPCLATGTIRRHPDLPHLKTAADLESLVQLQARLLDHASTLLNPGGMLVYCTCSLEPEEGEGQITAFLARNSAFVRLPIGQAELPGLEMIITIKGEIRAFPTCLEDRGGMDGFFVARMVYSA
jgi:16S rRNA (cytosine967-C5)-methyltransferase